MTPDQSPFANAKELAAIFKEADNSPAVLSSRLAVLEEMRSRYPSIADQLQAAGFIERDNRYNALALFVRIAGELLGGICVLVSTSYLYAAGALLRQLVEVEYLVFVGYQDHENLERWLGSSSEDLRKQFSPARMRKASDGLFNDHEYWTHCEAGGHPHPMARVLLSAYAPMNPRASLLPDAVHHSRRLWTSLRLLLRDMPVGTRILSEHEEPITTVLKRWEAMENPTILAFDGIGKSHNVE